MKQTSKKHGSFAILRLALAVCCLVALPVGAADQPKETTSKKYPPYPDVWGYELPYIEKGNRNRGFWFYKMRDGDYFVTYVTAVKRVRREDGTCCDVEKSYGGLSFFSGSRKSFTKKEIDAFQKEHAGRGVTGDLWFQDDTRIIQQAEIEGACSPLFPLSLVKINDNEQVVLRKKLLYLLEEPLKRPKAGGKCANEEPDEERVVPVSSKFVLLEDETFLLYDAFGNFIIRFDKHVNTRFPLNDKIFLVEAEEIEKLRKDLSDPAVSPQTIHDDVYKYLVGLKRGR